MQLKKECILKILIFLNMLAISLVLIFRGELNMATQPMIAEKTAVVYSSSEEVNFKNNILEEINKKRKEYNLELLKLNILLDISADKKALAMVETDIFAHTWNGRNSFSDEIYDVEYSNEINNIFGENLACGYDDSISLINAWMNSSGHRENLLKEGYKDIGVGINTLHVNNSEKCKLVVLHLGGSIK